MQVVVLFISDRINIAIDGPKSAVRLFRCLEHTLRTPKGPMGRWYRSPWLGGLILDDVSKKRIDCSGRMENLKTHSSRLSWSFAGSLEMNIFLNHIGYVGMSAQGLPRSCMSIVEISLLKVFISNQLTKSFLCGLLGVVSHPTDNSERT